MLYSCGPFCRCAEVSCAGSNHHQLTIFHPRECQHAETQAGQCCEIVYTPAYRPVSSLSTPLLRCVMHQPFKVADANPSRKTLVLDLDETLVHSTVKPFPSANFAVEIYLGGNYCKFHVFKRPYVDQFLRQVRVYVMFWPGHVHASRK